MKWKKKAFVLSWETGNEIVAHLNASCQSVDLYRLLATDFLNTFLCHSCAILWFMISFFLTHNILLFNVIALVWTLSIPTDSFEVNDRLPIDFHAPEIWHYVACKNSINRYFSATLSVTFDQKQTDNKILSPWIHINLPFSCMGDR